MAGSIIEDLKFKIRSGNPVTRLIIINTLVFIGISLIRVFVFFSGDSRIMISFEEFIIRNLAVPLNFYGLIHKPWTLITHMFTHIELAHIFWNMITLYWFGTILTNYTSTRKIIPLFILGGICGELVAMILVNTVPIFSLGDGATAIGASAGVTAIVIAAATLVPNYRMNLLFIGPVKLIYLAFISIFIDVVNLSSHQNMGGNLAHLGGALMGYIFIVQYKKGNDLAKPFNRFFDWSHGISSKYSSRSRMKVVHKRAISDEEYNQYKVVTQQTVDAILDKISKSGYESLSKSEKDILFKASTKK